jgi:hypothetical protein
MAVTAQTGVFSFGGQVGKTTISATFFKHRASDIDLATISDDRLGPPEVGGVPVPTIPYRAGVMASGGALINPRLESTIGWLLHGALGAWSVTADENALGVVVTGMSNHEFVFATDQGYVPYMSFQKEIPAEDDANDRLGEQFIDCKIVSATLALPNDGLITSRIDVLGRASGTNFEVDPTWAYDNTEFEDYQSIPIGSVTGGYLKVPGFSATALPVTAANVTLTNAPLDIRQEKNFGSPYLDEVTVVGRSLTVDLILKWKDPQLWQSIITGATDGTQWTAVPWVEDFDVYTVSPTDTPTSNPASPYDLRVQAPSVMYQTVGGIRLAGNQAVMLRVTGTAIADATGYCTINLGNEETDYTWPT